MKPKVFLSFLFTVLSFLISNANVSQEEMVNIAGQQRMLSQKLAKLYLMRAYGANLPELKQEFNEGKLVFEKNLKLLSNNATTMYSDLVSNAINNEVMSWRNFKFLLDAPVREENVFTILELSNKLLIDSNEVADIIEKESIAHPSLKVENPEVFHTINLSSKQHMLSQRLCVYFIAKKFLLKNNTRSPRIQMYLTDTFKELNYSLVDLLNKEINSMEIEEVIENTMLAFDELKNYKKEVLLGNASMNTVYAATNELTQLYDDLTLKYTDLAMLN